MKALEKYEKLIRTIPDYPKPGILFRDVTTLFGDADGFNEVTDFIAKQWQPTGVDFVAGIEARGFILGAVIADKLGAGFVPIRKAGKLPSKTVRQEYELEYGIDVIEIHQDAFPEGSNVLIVDDLIATGGTVIAATKLVQQVGGNLVGCAFLIDLPDIGGSALLREMRIDFSTFLTFPGH